MDGPFANSLFEIGGGKTDFFAPGERDSRLKIGTGMYYTPQRSDEDEQFISYYAEWTSRDFFVPPSLWGTGIGGRFLEKLVSHLRLAYDLYPSLKECKVELETRLGPDRTDLGSRQEMVDLTEFYKGAGFTPVKTSEKGQSVEIDLLGKP